MNHDCWTPRSESGFLMNPDPIADISTCSSPLETDAAEELQSLGDGLPQLISSARLRPTAEQLPVFDMSGLREWEDGRLVERAFQVYALLANAYVWCDQSDPATRLPPGIAVPLVQLAEIVERPPIVPYASTALSNFERLDPAEGYTVDNMRCIQKLVDLPDESWFHLTHVEIEMHAGQVLAACQSAVAAARDEDTERLESELSKIPGGFREMIATFSRIAHGCKPETYFHTLRPYLFGFENVVYEGVEKFRNEPQSFRGETGAQSTAIPAIKAFLGVEHQEGGLTEHLEIMKAYMPLSHRNFLEDIDTRAIRQFILRARSPGLTDAYNECLRGLTEFRTLHLKMAAAYVAKRVKNPIGTGGTEFMHWLEQLRNETAQHHV